MRDTIQIGNRFHSKVEEVLSFIHSLYAGGALWVGEGTHKEE